MAKQEFLLTGTGGQGLILAAIMLAEAGIKAGQNVAQSQSYGPEARGGAYICLRDERPCTIDGQIILFYCMFINFIQYDLFFHYRPQTVVDPL